MIQERNDAGQDDYRKGKMKDKMDTAKERCRAGWIQERKDAARTGWKQYKGWMQDRMDTEKERIHKRIDAEEEGFRR